MKTDFLFFLFSLMLFFSFCKKEQSLYSEATKIKLQTCFDEPLTDSLAITKNLVGAWNLITFGCSLCDDSAKMPEATLLFERDVGILNIKEANRIADTIHFSWVLVPQINSQNESTFQFQTAPNHYALPFTTFNLCEEFLFIGPLHVDGGFYLYEKQ